MKPVLHVLSACHNRQKIKCGSFNSIPMTESQQKEKIGSTGGNEAESGNQTKYLIIGVFMGVVLNATIFIS